MSNLFTRFERALAPSASHEDAESARTVRILSRILVLGILCLLAFWPVAVLVVPQPGQLFALYAGLVVGATTAGLALRWGRARLASVIAVASLWAHVTLTLWFYGGVRAPALSGFFLVVLVAAMLLGRRAALGWVGLCLVSSLGVLAAGAWGVLPPAAPPSPVRLWCVFGSQLVLLVGLSSLAAAEMRRSSELLRAEILERRSAEERLRQSQKLEAVGRLAGGVAHDFNNLLMVITGHGELLRRKLDTADPRLRKVQHMMSAADRASRLVRQLLAFSRSQDLEPRVLELNDLVRETARMLRPLLGADVSLLTELDPALSRVRADRTQIEQVLMNLAVNARDAMPAGGSLSFRTENREVEGSGSVPAGSYVVLTVRDTGAGMDAGTRSRVFEPFFTTKANGAGTGLGLAMAYGVVEQSGGHILLESEPGRGTAFHIHLPRVEAELDPAGPPEPTGTGASNSSSNSKGDETILVVEDESSIRELAQELLEGLGYEVLEARSEAEALTVVTRRSDPIHLTLADVVMPGVDVKDLVRRLREHQPDMRVLYMSGHDAATLASHGVREGESDFLPKPFGQVQLAHRVRQILDKPAATSSA